MHFGSEVEKLVAGKNLDYSCVRAKVEVTLEDWKAFGMKLKSRVEGYELGRLLDIWVR